MRYKDLEIPAGAQAAFEAYVRQLSGKINKPATFTEDLTVVWKRETQQARELLEQFRNPRDSQIEEAVRNGLRRLVEDGFTEYYWDADTSTRKRRPMALKPDINWGAVQETLATYFETSLADERMNLYHVNTTHGKLVLVRPSQKQSPYAGPFPYLTPREVSVAIQFYGLTRGERMSIREITIAHGLIAPSLVSSDLGHVKFRLQEHQPLRKLVLNHQ